MAHRKRLARCEGSQREGFASWEGFASPKEGFAPLTEGLASSREELASSRVKVAPSWEGLALH